MRHLGLLFSAPLLLVSCGARSDIDRIPSDAGATTCEDMKRDLAEKLAAAQVCDPTLDEPSCNHVVEGECCLDVVAPDNPKAIADYEAALARGREKGCFGQLCKNVKCALPITGDCVALPASSRGRCKPVF